MIGASIAVASARRIMTAISVGATRNTTKTSGEQMLLPSMAFATLLRRIQPLASERGAAHRHAQTIQARLATAFNVRNFQVVGSHARSTAIRSYSDVDYFAVVAREDARWGGRYMTSDTVLDTVRNELRARFPTTNISRDGQAVVLDFGQADFRVDVVPAIFAEFRPNVGPIFGIPDGNGGWMTTSPAGHNKFLQTADRRSGGKLKRTAQLIKFWRECRQPRVALSSFHVEMVLARERICEGAKSYAVCLAEAFDVLRRREGRAQTDPLGVAGNIPAARTGTQREGLIAALDWARDHAFRACDAEARGDFAEASRQWDIVFNGRLPKTV
jgi:hypothetical protein